MRTRKVANRRLCGQGSESESEVAGVDRLLVTLISMGFPTKPAARGEACVPTSQAMSVDVEHTAHESTFV